jgi:hypothetical protein
MVAAPPRSIAWGPVVGALVAGAAMTGVVAWRFNLQGLESQIAAKQAALKKLVLSGGIPPNQGVMDYLTSRRAALEDRYQQWVQRVAAPPLAEAAKADPQLYFQQQFHEVQRTLERLATARGMPVPEQLGFPKELPPSDTVPRLLVQLALIQEAASVILEESVTALASLKVADPESVPVEQGGGTFLVRLPVRIRLTATLTQLMNILGAMERAAPLIEVRAIGVQQSGADSGALEVELVLARYLVMAGLEESAAQDEAAAPVEKKSAARSKKAVPPTKPETWRRPSLSGGSWFLWWITAKTSTPP